MLVRCATCSCRILIDNRALRENNGTPNLVNRFGRRCNQLHDFLMAASTFGGSHTIMILYVRRQTCLSQEPLARVEVFGLG
jgi:hypothetical protein